MTDLAEACRNADIVVTTTSATTPIIDADWIHPGTRITAVGADAPGKNELDLKLLQQADVLAADSRAQCLDHGEFSAINTDDETASTIVEIGELLAGRPGRQRANDITIADLTGIAAQDIAAANHILNTLDTT